MNKGSTHFQAYDGHMDDDYWIKRRKLLGLKAIHDMSAFCEPQCEELPLDFYPNRDSIKV